MDRLTDELPARLPADPPDRSGEDLSVNAAKPAGDSAVAPAEDLLESQIDPDIEAIILRYFETFNAGDFAATAALFAEDGALFPPFESPVVGAEAIAAYLKREAQGMRIEVRQCVQEISEAGLTEVKVAGKVQTPLFGVNVAWMFGFNDRLEVLAVRIKLLAALEDLLKLKS